MKTLASIVLNLHREETLALRAVQSLRDLIAATRAAGLSVEVTAVLDAAGPITRRVIKDHRTLFDDVIEVQVRDLGLARNAGIKASSGEYIALLDGDDLWGSDWIVRGLECARERGDAAIWHPQYVYFFDQEDHRFHVPSSSPSRSTASFFMEQISSDDPDFDPRALFINNVWTSNCIAHRNIFLERPFRSVDREQGLGFEDWTWNIETLVAGIAHRIVPNVIHMVRMKRQGSLGGDSLQGALLPRLPSEARSLWLEPSKGPVDRDDERLLPS